MMRPRPSRFSVAGGLHLDLGLCCAWSGTASISKNANCVRTLQSVASQRGPVPEVLHRPRPPCVSASMPNADGGRERSEPRGLHRGGRLRRRRGLRRTASLAAGKKTQLRETQPDGRQHAYRSYYDNLSNVSGPYVTIYSVSRPSMTIYRVATALV